MDFSIPLAPVSQGYPITIDGIVYRTLRRDANDALQVAVASLPLPTGAATSARQDTMITALQLIDDLRTALAAVATDQLRADVISSALPSGAATAARQDTMITALQLIDDLRNALNSVATDVLRVLYREPTAFTNTQVSVGTSSTQVLAANASRLYAAIVNDSDTAIYLAIEDAAVLNNGIRLNANGGSFEINHTNLITDTINAISSAASKILTVIDGT